MTIAVTNTDTWAFQAGRLLAVWTRIASRVGRYNYLGTAKVARDLMSEPASPIAMMLRDLTTRWQSRMTAEEREWLSEWCGYWIERDFSLPKRCKHTDVIEIASGQSRMLSE